MSPVRLRISAKWIRLACLPLSFIIALSSLPIHLKHNSAFAQGSVPRRTQGPPSSNLPNIDEARRIKPGPPKAPNPVPSTKCRHRDAACKRARGEAPINQPQGADGNNDELVARVDNDSLSNRFAASERVAGRGFGVPAIDALLNKLSRPAPDTPVGGSLRNNRNVAGVETAPAAVTQIEGDLAAALLDPSNRKGDPDEDLLSRNFNWGLQLLSIPGRAGLDLGIGLSYNSLVFTKYGLNIEFDPDWGNPTPGFRLGFPTIRGTYFSQAGSWAYMLFLPSGGHVELRQTGANVYEAADSSYLHLTYDPTTQLLILRTTDGTQLKFQFLQDEYKCKEIKDRNGNYITINYGAGWAGQEISNIIDTTGRAINLNYDGNGHIISITQLWGGQTHTWATFAYGTKTLQTNFSGVFLVGATNGQSISVLNRVGLHDGSVYSFEYNTYCQVKTIRRYAPNNSNPVNFPGDYLQLAYTTYGLPDDAGSLQTDCPRITSRADWAYDWNPGVTSVYATDPGYAWGKVTLPDGTIYKELFATTGWQRGLTTQAETWSGGVRKKWTTFDWTQDNTGVSYRLNPRVTGTNVYDEAGNHSRRATSYTSFGLVSDVYEYDADATTVLRHTHTDYNLGEVYTSRRIIGLPSALYLYDGNNTLFSKVTYEYDQNQNPRPLPQRSPVQHDTANYGSTFVQGRGNLNLVRRWDVNDPNNVLQASEYKTVYNTSGSVTLTRDPLGRQTTLSYSDSFSDGQNFRNTFAYPTTATDPDNFSSTVQYNYDFGAVTRTQNPKGAAVTRTYDAAGRIERTTNTVNGAYMRYVYGSNQRYVQSFTTVNDLSSEFYSINLFDGLGRVRGAASDHPGSVGGYKAQNYEYDIMGRQVRQTNPTEINVAWEQAGDDAAGWVSSSQAYDWQGRPTVYTNQDGTTRSISYSGCGCAGGQVVTFIDEMQKKRDQTYDVLGRLLRERTYYDNIGTPEPYDLYTTTTNTYNVRDQITNITVDSLGESQNTVMTYDGHGRLKTDQAPIYLGNPQSATPYTSYEYYKDDMVMSVTDPRGAGVTYSYNNRGLVTNLSYSVPTGVASTPNLSFGYDEVGSRLWMDDGPGRIDYEYNLQGDLKKETRLFDELPAYQYELSYEYNLQNQLRSVTTRRNGAVDTALNFDYDRSGRLATVYGSGYGGSNPFYFTSPSSPIKYRAWDVTKQITYGNNRTMNVSYNGRLQTTGVEMPGLMSVTYVYKYDGRIAQIDDDWQQPDPYYPWLSRRIKARYNYDDVGRVNNTDDFYAPFHQHFMFYNGFDNLTNTSKGMGPAASIADYLTTFVNNRDQSSDMEYDQAGQMTRIKSAQYSFDAIGRPTSQSDINLSLWYDGDGLQIKHTQSNSQASFTRYFLRSSAMGGEVLAELNQNGDKIYNYIYANGAVIAEYNHTGQSLPDHTFGPKGVQLGDRGNEPVLWTHADQSNRIRWTTRSDGAHTSHWYLDEVGNLYRTGPGDHAETDYFTAIYLRQFQSALEFYLALFGDGSNLSGGCSINGVNGSCDQVYWALNSGTLFSGQGTLTPPTFPRSIPSISWRALRDALFDALPSSGIVNVDPITPPFANGFLPGQIGLSAPQTDPCAQAIIDAAPASMRAGAGTAVPLLLKFADLDDFLNTQLAYVFATVEHESQFTPIYENGSRKYFNKYEPGTKRGRSLGNTQQGDGYTYRGAGYVQLTGRANYRKYGIENTPAMALDPNQAAYIAIDGMENGVFTGKKLSKYINDKKTDYRNARRVVNGIDKRKLIASYVPKYLKALKDCGRLKRDPVPIFNRGRL